MNKDVYEIPIPT